MKQGGYIKRGKRVNPVNRKRKAALFRKQFLSVERVLWVHEQGCAAFRDGFYGPCDGPIECAHIKTRATGGTWRDILPLCKRHHAEQHAIGNDAFAHGNGLNIWAIAAELATRGPQE